MEKVKQGRNFVFTLNNPTGPPVFPAGCEYAYQLEEGEAGTPHYQGYVVFKKMQRLSALKKLLPEAHWENRKGSHDQALAYSTKEDTRIEAPVNTFTARTPGCRTDLIEAAALIRTKGSWADVIADEDLYEVLAKHPRFVQQIYQHKLQPLLTGVELRAWQQSLLDELLGEPDSRAILWYYDPIGNLGKSWMARYLAINHRASIFSAGKSADIAHALDNPKIVVWDLSRSLEEHVNYGVMEDVKNGVIFSPKYESGTKIFPIPHVVVFSNFPCPSGKFSDDRIRNMLPSNLNSPSPNSAPVSFFRLPHHVK